jgi:hypothetical protein
LAVEKWMPGESSSTMRPRACAVAPPPRKVAPTGLLRTRKNASSGSASVSPMTGTLMVREVTPRPSRSPGLKTTVALKFWKSCGATAVPSCVATSTRTSRRGVASSVSVKVRFRCPELPSLTTASLTETTCGRSSSMMLSVVEDCRPRATPALGLPSVRTSVSSGSASVSARSCTSMVFRVSPAAKESVPPTGAKSSPGVAVPPAVSSTVKAPAVPSERVTATFTVRFSSKCREEATANWTAPAEPARWQAENSEVLPEVWTAVAVTTGPAPGGVGKVASKEALPAASVVTAAEPK